jgi:hypothetical protein
MFAHADTPKGYCPNAWKLYGLFMGASLACNFAETDAVRKVQDALKDKCDVNNVNVSKPFIGAGITQFHTELAQKGHAKACGEMFEFMDRFGGSN